MKITVKGGRSIENVVYEYGARVDRNCIPALKNQFKLAHDTYNEIVAELKRIAKEARAWLEEKAGEDAKRIRQRIDVLNQAFKEAKAQDDRELLTKIAEERRGLWRAYYEQINAVRAANRAELKELFESHIRQSKDCRIYQIRSEAVAKGLGWADGDAILTAAIQAWNKQWPKLKEPNFKSIHEVTQQFVQLRFKKDVTGSVIKHGKHSSFAIEGDDFGKRAYLGFRFNVGSGELLQQVAGTVYVHRPLPDGARLLRARLVEKRVGKDNKYYIQLVLELKPEDAPAISSEKRQPLVALDFGWFFEEDGRRIAGLADADDPGMAKILRLPPEIETLFERAEAISGQRDTLRDEVAGELLAMSFTEAPEAISDDLRKLKLVGKPNWVAPSRLARIVLRWKESCPDYLPDWLERLEAWRKADKLLWQASSHVARRARNARRNLYEGWALDLCKRYERIVIDTPDLAKSAKVKDKTTGKHSKLGATARSGRFRVSLSEFRLALEWAAARAETVIADILGRTSKTCAHCGGNAEVHEENSRVVICQNEGCGAVEDRELNAAAVVYQNALQRIEEIDLRYAEMTHAEEEKVSKRKEAHALRLAARLKSHGASDDATMTSNEENHQNAVA